MTDDERLINLIYDGAQDDAAWRLALNKVAERVRAVGVGLGIQDMTTHAFRSLGQVGIDTGLNTTYQRLAPGNRIWREIGARKQALTDHMVAPKSDFVRTELYADWFAPQRFHSVMAAPTLFENSASAVLVAFRDSPRGDFEPADLAQAERFAGHFGAALRFRFAQERTAAELAAVHFMLDELPDAIFLVTRTGLLRHANVAGRRMLDSGTPARMEKGRLELHRPVSTERLLQMIAAARGEMRMPKHGGGAWIVHLHASARACGAGADGHLVVRIRRPGAAWRARGPGAAQPTAGPERPAGAGGRRAGARRDGRDRRDFARREPYDNAHPHLPRLRSPRGAQPRCFSRSAGEPRVRCGAGRVKIIWEMSSAQRTRGGAK